jgi:hypothetical protein
MAAFAGPAQSPRFFRQKIEIPAGSASNEGKALVQFLASRLHEGKLLTAANTCRNVVRDDLIFWRCS